MTYTAADHARAIERSASGLVLHALVDTGNGSGVILSGRLTQPDVLGFGAVDQFGETAALALSEEEAAAVRDALDEWLDSRRG